jgi:outer membrane protein OmpA-like peptidoglycan-associated protein
MTTISRATTVAVCAAMLVLAGCPSAYQRSYEQKTEQLEAQQRFNQQQESLAHVQAQKYAAVVYFAVGSAAIDDDGQRQLRWFLQQMQPYPQASFNVQGFTDSTGSEASNQDLAGQRSANVAASLNSQGIAMSRIATTGFGEAYAAETNATTQGRRNNRRVEVTVR